LVIQIVPRRILIQILAKINETILSDKVVVGKRKEVVLIFLFSFEQDHALPFFVQKTCVLRTAVVNTETIELRIDVEVDKAAIFCRCNVGVEITS
jgi:hypothetical protein